MKNPIELVKKAKDNITEIDVQTAQTTCHSADYIIDVREPAEYAEGHLENSVNLPRGVLEFKIASLDGISDDSNIVVYCKTSGRSALAAESLQQLGFTNVKSMVGGFDAWSEAGCQISNS